MPSPEDLDTGSFSSAAMAADVVAAMAMFETRLYNAFLRFVKTITDDVALMSLLDDIQNGVYIAMTPGVEDRLAQINIPTKDLARIQRQALARAARTTAKNVGMTGRLDLTSPTAIDKARKITAEMVRYVTEETKAALRELVGQVVAGDMTKAAAKRLIGQRVGLLPQHANAVGKYYDKLLETFDRGRAQEMADQYAQRLLEYRAENIARTEIARAMSSGQLEVWEQMQAQGLLPSNVMRTWIVSFDERLCRLCEPMNGITAAIDGTWLTTNGILVRVPTDIHPQCRCTSGLVFVDEVGKADPLGWEHWQIAKHYEHDQRSHGNWARYRAEDQRSMLAEMDVAGQFKKPTARKAHPLRFLGPGDTEDQLGLDPSTSTETRRMLAIAGYDEEAKARTDLERWNIAAQAKNNIVNRMRDAGVTNEDVGKAIDKLWSMARSGDYPGLVRTNAESNALKTNDSLLNGGWPAFRGEDPTEYVVSAFRLAWERSSLSLFSVGLKAAAEKRLGAVYEVEEVHPDNVRFWRDALKNESVSKVFEALVQAQYDETQAVLKGLGLKHVMLVRGVFSEAVGFKKDRNQVYEADINHRALSSFSSKVRIAEGFGDTVLLQRVPIEDIFSMGELGGVGMQAEGEFVVINRNGAKSFVVATPDIPYSDRRLAELQAILDQLSAPGATVSKHYDHDQRSHGNWARGQQAQAPVALANRLAGESPIEEFPVAKLDEITSRLLGKGTFGDYAARVIEDKYGFTKSEMAKASNQLQALVVDLYNIHYNRPEHDRYTNDYRVEDRDDYGSITATSIAASIIDDYSRSWSHSSSNESSMILKFAAGKWLGASVSRDYGEWWQGRLDKLQESFDKFLVESPEGAKFLKAFVETQYETTQKVFAELGVTHVLLSRGLGLEGRGYSKQEKASGRPVISNWADITVADLDTTSDRLSSWSYRISAARKFGATKQYSDTSSGAMLYARVPVANIFSFSGLGVSTSSYSEGEVVLLGRPQRVLSFRANKSKLNKYAPSRWEDVLEAANSYGTDIFGNTSGGLSKHYEHDQRSHGNWARYRAEDQRAMLAEMDVAGQFKRSNKPANYKDVLGDTDAIERLFKVEGSFVDENGVTKKWEATDMKVSALSGNSSSAFQRVMGFIKVEGKTVGSFSRYLYRNGTVKHSRFFMNENFSGKGIGGSFIKQTVANLKEAGFKKIRIGSIMQSFYTGEAGQNNGTLVWAKLGFKLESWGGPDKIKTSRQLVDAYQKELDLLTKMAMDPSNRRATDTLVRAKERVITNRDNDAKFPLLINGLSAEYSLDLTKPLPETLAKAAEWDLDVWDDVLSEWVEPPLDDGATS